MENKKGRCQECVQERVDDRFKCSQNQVHMQCQNCQIAMPKRNDYQQNPQNCTICERSYCNLYFQQDCQQKFNHLINCNLKRFKDLPIPPKIMATHIANRMEELTILEDEELRTTIIYQHMSEKFVKKGAFKYEISKKYMRTTDDKSHNIQMDTPICQSCWSDVWNQMVLKFRIDIQSQLPQNIQNRPNCWYGINCNLRNTSHCNKFNHCCPQTR